MNSRKCKYPLAGKGFANNWRRRKVIGRTTFGEEGYSVSADEVSFSKVARGLAAAGLLTSALASATAWALPQAGTVAAGSATISTPTSTSLRIDQTTT